MRYTFYSDSLFIYIYIALQLLCTAPLCLLTLCMCKCVVVLLLVRLLPFSCYRCYYDVLMCRRASATCLLSLVVVFVMVLLVLLVLDVGSLVVACVDSLSLSYLCVLSILFSVNDL